MGKMCLECQTWQHEVHFKESPYHTGFIPNQKMLHDEDYILKLKDTIASHNSQIQEYQETVDALTSLIEDEREDAVRKLRDARQEIADLKKEIGKASSIIEGLQETIRKLKRG